MYSLVKDIREHAIEYGSIPFWSWNDKLDPEELRRQIRVMHDLKMKGFFMHARGGLETEYMSEEWFDCIRACVDEAKKLGMEAWSYDENGWPSGFAGGKLLEDPANWASYIKHEISTEFPVKDHVLGVYVTEDGKCRRVTEAQPGISEYIAVIQNWDSSYVDTLDGEITAKFLQETHALYEEKVGFSEHMPGFFTDEPQYYRYETPWSEKLPAAFAARYGYEVFEGLAALFVDYEGAEEFRWDYYRLCHELFINGFIKVIYEWCEEHGCKLTGHGVEESILNGQMWCCGGIMPFYEYEHIPGIDYLGRNIDTDIAPKQLGSACQQLGKKQAISEMYGCCGWDVTPRELKRIAELQYVNGVNMMCQHLYPYSERGQRKGDYPCHYSEHLPWQHAMKEFDQYFNNLGYIVSRGTEMARVLVIHPIHSAYLTYKRKEDGKSVAELEKDLRGLNALLSERQIPYHFGDECMMAKMGSVEGARIRVGLCTYDHVVIPAMDTLDKNTADMLKAYLENGGKVYLYGKAPSRIDGRKSDLGWLKGNCTLEDIQDTAQSVITAEGKHVPQLRQMVRDTEYGRIFFITNLTNEEIHNVNIRVKNCSNLNILDVNTLEYRPVCGQREADGSVTVTLTFEDAGSYVLVDMPDKEEAFLPAKQETKTAPIVLENNFVLSHPIDNVMTLDYAQISYDGVNYEKTRPIILIKDMLLRARYKGDVYLKYSFRAEELPEHLKVAAEPLVYKSITVNGTHISLDGDWWFDRSFKTADIAPYVREGCNEIVMQIAYYQREYVYEILYGNVMESLRNCLSFDTEIEFIYLIGDFGVKTEPALMEETKPGVYCYTGDFCMVSQKETIDLTNVVTDRYPFFAGVIEAQTVYQHVSGGPTELYITGRYAVCEVSVNGTYAGRMLFKHHLDLSGLLQEGDNVISLKLYNSNRNLLGPHHYAEPEPTGVGPATFSLESMWEDEQCKLFKERYAFVRFGIDCK